jgi:hypothetical protein
MSITEIELYRLLGELGFSVNIEDDQFYINHSEDNELILHLKLEELEGMSVAWIKKKLKDVDTTEMPKYLEDAVLGLKDRL